MKYKVLQICASNAGGAGIAASRLNKALRVSGITSDLLCMDKCGYDEHVTRYDAPLYARIINRLPIKYKNHKYDKIRAEISNKYEIITFPESIFDITKHPLVKDADIINLHWLGEMVDFKRFFRHVEKPIVWTLHDMNPFLGFAHYYGDVLKNPEDKTLQDRIMRLKVKTYNKNRSITIVDLCPWMQKYSINSEAFAEREHVIIPNSINTSIFKVRDIRSCRKTLCLPEDKPTIMFCSQSLNNKRKGFDILKRTLPLLSENFNFIVVGDNRRMEINKFSDNTYFFGDVSDELLLSILYSSANLFILPSREDNLPNTMLESLCCGTPVLSFANGGMSDTISSGFNGLIVKEQTPEALCNGIESFFKSINQYSRNDISADAHAKYSPSVQALKYDRLYRSLLMNK